MSASRRDFIQRALATGGALSLGFQSELFARPAPRPRALRILILGGTSFLGPHLVRYAFERGHAISVFNRGRTNPRLHAELFDRVEHLEGDRNGDLKSIETGTWDAVIDNSGQRVEWARDAAQLLKDRVRFYLYVSSTGVYLPYRTANIREDTKLVLADDPPLERPSYGVMKSLSEMEVQKALPRGAIVVRPTYIVGPGDTSDRFPYWPVRVERGGEVLVPGKKTDPVQFIDVRDLTEFMIRLIENGTTGVFNVAGPANRLSMEEFVHGVRAGTSSEVTWTWIEDYDFLLEQKLQFAIPWLMLTEDYLGSAQISIDRAKAAGLTFRPLGLTVMDTLGWWHSDAVPAERKAGPRFVLTPERELEILAAWKAKTPAR
jgi:2'-hydroxyisoflavone reductase